MLKCQKCNNFYRDRFNLNKHLSRKKPCVNEIQTIPDDTEKKDVKIDTSDVKIDTINVKNRTIDVKNRTIDDKIDTSESKNCQFCLNTFSSVIYKKRHETICKHREDETRKLEIDLGIKPDIPTCKTECRFCNKNLSRSNALSRHTPICKERLDYHEQLLKQQKEKNEKNEKNIQQANTIINGNHNTINNNTININVFGERRSLEHVEVENIIQFLRDLKKHHLPEQTYEQAGNLIVMMENYIQQNESNKNFVIPDYKSSIGYIKKENDWEITGIDNPLNSQFKDTAGILCEKKEEIDNTNKKVFQSNTNREIFRHVKNFNEMGFNHSPYGDQKMKVIKSSYKISKLKNKNVVDF